jgi:nicotinamidase-related amidase
MAPPHTVVVLVDPYNDFLHPQGKAYSRVSESLTATNTVAHMQELVDAARAARIPIYYALHQQFKDGNYAGWKHMNVSTTRIQNTKMFEEESWGAKIYEGMEPDVLGNEDVVVSKHWNSRLVDDCCVGRGGVLGL